MIPYKDKIIITFLESSSIVCEIVNSGLKSEGCVKRPIKEGNWDYLHLVQGNHGLLAVYGKDVEAHAEFGGEEWEEEAEIKFNEYEHFCQIPLNM